MFVVYGADHEIVATIIGPGKDYVPILQPGQGFKFFEETVSVDPFRDCLDPNTLEIVQRSQMEIAADKPSIKADGTDTIKLTGIPANTSTIIALGSQQYASETVNDGEVEFAATTAGVYTFMFTNTRYFPQTLTVEAK